MLVTTAQYKGERVLVVDLKASTTELETGGFQTFSTIVWNGAVRPVFAEELIKVKLLMDKEDD